MGDRADPLSAPAGVTPETPNRNVLCVWPDRLRPVVTAAFLVALGSGAALAVGGTDWGETIPHAARIALAFTSVLAGLLGALVTLGAGLSRAPLRVGADGVAIGLAAPRFVPYADIDRLERDRTRRGHTHHLAVLVLRSGERLHVGASVELDDPATLTRVGAAQGELDEALERHRLERHGGKATTARAALFARGDRGADDWLRELRARAQPGGFRETTLEPTEPLAVIEDPTAEPTARAGALVALCALGLTDEHRTRVRAAAAATAAPRLRVALEAVAADANDEAHIADAVTRVERGG